MGEGQSSCNDGCGGTGGKGGKEPGSFKPFRRNLNAKGAASFNSLSAKDIDGNMVMFEKYKGNVLYVINVASR